MCSVYWLLRDPRKFLVMTLAFAFVGSMAWIMFNIFFLEKTSAIGLLLGLPMTTVIGGGSLAGLKYLH